VDSPTSCSASGSGVVSVVTPLNSTGRADIMRV
jgi:hypothetical protein